MSFSTITIPASVGIVPVDTRLVQKVLYLPTVSTNAGRFLYFKDYYGTASNSTFTLSTTGMDLIDDYNFSYTFSNSFGMMSLLSDGLRSWRTIGLYDGSSTPAAPGSFNPTNITGGFMWLDASIIGGSDGASITTWSSASPSLSYYMTGTATLKTGILNGLRVLQFSTSQNMSINTAITGTTFTFFFVSRQIGGTNRRVFIGNGNKLYGYWNGGKSQLYMEGWISAAGSPASDTNWDIYTLTRNSSGGGTFSRYGTTLHTFGSSGGGLDSFFINTGGCCGGETSDCQVAEIALYTTTLTDNQCRQIEGYLAWKWGLQANLPSGHLYKNSAP